MLLIAVCLGVAAQATVADADTLDRQRYVDRLAQARAALVSARAAGPAARTAFVDRARDLLRQTTALHFDDGSSVSVDDGPIAGRIDTSDPALDAAIADVALLADMASPSTTIDPVAADARLRQLVGEHRARGAQVSLVDLLSRWLARSLSRLNGSPPDIRIVITVAAGLGLALLLVVLGILGRDLRERFRRDVVLPELRAERGVDPAAHLRDAEDALRDGRARDAIRALYLYAIAALAAREMIRYDPSLTDRELLARAGAIPNAAPLRELVELHALVWYGLREARSGDAERARALARRAVA